MQPNLARSAEKSEVVCSCATVWARGAASAVSEAFMHGEIRVCCTGKALIRLALLSEHVEKRLKLSSKLQARSYFKAYSRAEVFKEKSAPTGGGWDGEEAARPGTPSTGISRGRQVNRPWA